MYDDDRPNPYQDLDDAWGLADEARSTALGILDVLKAIDPDQVNPDSEERVAAAALLLKGAVGLLGMALDEGLFETR